jgi:hypothetical protein
VWRSSSAPNGFPPMVDRVSPYGLREEISEGIFEVRVLIG